MALAVNGNGANVRAWEWFWRVLSAVAVPWAIWMSLMLIDVRERVAVIEGNRFTSQDAFRMIQELHVDLEAKVDKADVPPEWFVDRVILLEKRVEKYHP